MPDSIYVQYFLIALKPGLNDLLTIQPYGPSFMSISHDLAADWRFLPLINGQTVSDCHDLVKLLFLFSVQSKLVVLFSILVTIYYHIPKFGENPYELMILDDVNFEVL